MANVYFSSLPWTLVVSASPKSGQVLKAGKDHIMVTWALNRSFPAATDLAYEKVLVRLCYAPVSQADRGWRKTADDLKKDKTCQLSVALQPYQRSKSVVNYTVARDVPTATYFVRVYALDSSGVKVAYGQTTDAQKTTNLFDVVGITGRHASVDIAAACFSAASVLTLACFLVAEKRKKANVRK
ncbi:hypothetical protein HPP92_024277 [Vanilla planifolia]|uniref:High-affinity nitrate transporter n=1 Tax=Vanilla planifolia TaxID=51239 RepID=A0A835PJD2_VANPL|nr:hypothetical protein HPP92_024277 [Vanilla planifolia]